jgi:hypothetical protein
MSKDVIVKYSIHSKSNGDQSLTENSDSQNERGAPTESFYAVNPLLKPLPPGMKMFGVKNSSPFTFFFAYDIFDVKEDNVYFIAYNQAVEGTITLHIYIQHITGKPLKNFISLSSTVPKGYVRNHIPEVYVFNHIPKYFSCNNVRCIPWSPELKNSYNYTPLKNNKLSLTDCLNSCLKKTKSKGAKPYSIYASLSDFNTFNSGESNTSSLSKKKCGVLTVTFLIIVTILIAIILFKLYA